MELRAVPHMKSIQEVLPLSPLQKGLLFHAVYDPGDIDPYVVQLEYEIIGNVESSRLWRAIDNVVARHNNLCAAFAYRDLQDPVQIIFDSCPIPRHEIDLTSWSSEESASAYQQAVNEDRARQFDVEVPPLFRFTLIRVGDRTVRLLFTCHHLLIDGWSTATLIGEISRA